MVTPMSAHLCPGLLKCSPHQSPCQAWASVEAGPGPEFRNRVSNILEPTPRLGAVDAVHHVGGPAVHGGVDGGHGRSLGGLDLLPFLDIVTGAAVNVKSPGNSIS